MFPWLERKADSTSGYMFTISRIRWLFFNNSVQITS